MQKVATQYLEEIGSYYMQRVPLETACTSNPNIEDYGRALYDFDYSQFISMRDAVIQLRNEYFTMHHLMTTNWQKMTETE